MLRKLLFSLTLVILLINIGFGDSYDISFTEEELDFIKENPVIRLGVDPYFVPFEFIENNQYVGITADYIKIIENMTGLKFEVVEGLKWVEAYDMALAGEIDVLPAVSKTLEREIHFLFSEPYYYFKRSIVTRDTNTEIKDLENLYGRTVAVQRNSSHHSYLIDMQGINLSLYNSVQAALVAVSDGTEEVFLGNLSTTNYLIKNTGIPNLKLISFDAERTTGLHFATRKEWPVLISILNKSLQAIPNEELVKITETWIDLETDFDYTPLFRIIAITLAILTIVVLVSVYWITKLRTEIQMRIKAQESLEVAKVDAEIANELKSSFLARMSHEIRTPLGAIIGMGYLLKQTDLSGSQSSYVERITHAGKSMLSIINDILDYSKIEAGKIEIEKASLNLDNVIQGTTNIVSYYLENKKIGFKFSKDPYLPTHFMGDAKRVEQVLVNVINNAIKFTDEGEVSLSVSMVAKEDDMYHIAFSVKDTGIGMTKEEVNKLFTPFVQAGSSINRKYGGTGLGLSIVKNLIEMMNGYIEVFSTKGEGSTFIIHIPLEIDEEKEVEHNRKYSKDYFKDLRVLVVEKSGTNINIIDSYLGAFGLHCELTNSEHTAIDMLEVSSQKYARRYDLLIVDFDTPENGGFEFVKNIKSNENIVMKPKSIVLLPMNSEELYDLYEIYDVDKVVGKPVIPSVLFDSIIEMFEFEALVKPDKVKKSVDEEVSDKGTILLVEDNKTIQLIASTILGKNGYQVLVSDNGEQGLDEFKKNKDKIDLILMDLHMPIMNGYQTTREIREISKVPIVAMSADVIEGVIDRCIEAGMDDYISKPFEPEKLINKVQSFIATNEKPYTTGSFNTKKGVLSVGDENLYKIVLEEFISENANFLDEIDAYVKEKEYENLIELTHRIKSSVGSIGADYLYDIIRDVEIACKEGNLQEVDKLLIMLKQAYKKLQKEIQEYLKNR